MPVRLVKVLLISGDQIVRSDYHVEGRVLQAQVLGVEELSQNFSFRQSTPIRKDLQTWTELFDLFLPIEQCGTRSNDEERSPLILVLCQMSKQRDGLNGLSKSHLICKNAIDSLNVKRVQPLQAFELVLLKSSFEARWGFENARH